MDGDLLKTLLFVSSLMIVLLCVDMMSLLIYKNLSSQYQVAGYLAIHLARKIEVTESL